MKEKKKHLLLLIDPSGQKYEIGFLSPCKDGFVLGTPQIRKSESSHLTILNKRNTLSAHITPQKTLREKQYFPPLSIKEFSSRLESLLSNKLVFKLSQEQLSEDIMYVTIKFKKWFNALIKTLFQKETKEEAIIHTINFKNLLDKIPKMLNEFRIAPQSFMGLCKAGDMLKDSSKIAGITNSGILIIPSENELIGVDFKVFTNFDFKPSMKKSQLDNPISELYQSLGINQYIQQEVMGKKFFENLLSKETWQAASSKLGKYAEKQSDKNNIHF